MAEITGLFIAVNYGIEVIQNCDLFLISGNVRCQFEKTEKMEV